MAQTTIMESCLLCLDLRSDKLNCISTDSKKWQELNIANTVEKHFWPLNTIQFNSFICSPCWRLVYDFHKFYLRVEEAHMKLIVNGEKQNVEDYCIQKLEVNQEVIADVNIKNEPLELCEDLESNVNESYTGSVISGTSRKRKRSEEDLNNELEDLNDNDSESVSDIDESIDVYSQSDTNSSENDGINADDENDKLIVDYLKQINCNICNIQLESFSAVRKHFLEVHQEKGYLLCCNRKFFRRKYLVDHIHCHLNPNYFRCAPCDKIFSGRKLLGKHKCRSHGLGQITKRHSCDICGKYFFKEQNLKMHKMSHVPAAEKNSWNERNELKIASEQANLFKGKMKYFPPQANPTCASCQDNSKKLDTILQILAEHTVLLNCVVSQNVIVENITSIFPIVTEEKLQELDNLLATQPDPYIRQMKNLIAGNVERNLHQIFDQNIIMNFNVDGTYGKKSLRDFVNVLAAILDIISTFNNTPDKTLRAAFQRQKKKYFKQNSRNNSKGRVQNDENVEEK